MSPASQTNLILQQTAQIVSLLENCEPGQQAALQRAASVMLKAAYQVFLLELAGGRLDDKQLPGSATQLSSASFASASREPTFVELAQAEQDSSALQQILQAPFSPSFADTLASAETPPAAAIGRVRTDDANLINITEVTENRSISAPLSAAELLQELRDLIAQHRQQSQEW